MGRSRMTLAGQFLVLQLLIVLLVVATVGGLSFAQTGHQLARAESRRALSAAENLAGNATVRALLRTALPGGSSALAAVGETVRTVSGSTSVALLRPDRTVLESSVPAPGRHDAARRRSPRAGVRSWTGPVPHSAVAAEVPVLDDEGPPRRHRPGGPAAALRREAAGRGRPGPARLRRAGDDDRGARLDDALPPHQAADPGPGADGDRRARRAPRGAAARDQGGRARPGHRRAGHAAQRLRPAPARSAAGRRRPAARGADAGRRAARGR